MKIFIDGEYGTTGLHLAEQIKQLGGAELLSIPHDKKKDVEAKTALLNCADVVFLCLPDEAAIASAKLVINPKTVIIDCSTAHRTEWTYGFAELDDKFFSEIKTSNRIANPGCHATGFCAVVYPLIKHGIIPPDKTVCAYSLTGYSGGGRAVIEEYETNNIKGAAIYSLGLKHKHLPEMQKVCGLEKPPIFSPIITDVPRGMLVGTAIEENCEKVYNVLSKHYENTAIKVKTARDARHLDVDELATTNKLTIYVTGNEQQTLAIASLDNLGKGAGGAAIQNFKIRTGALNKI
ncbi:MAG: N-acetyl-gamma-glutamyl-phosphate reductase [Clostridiales bacterium]|jgi:N-acetyl-gamma-glutamyl-phosphate reductase|nr:N-acetyl-gamma-glutamyl-phosphate reductase [Clostridiales bacterium]